MRVRGFYRKTDKCLSEQPVYNKDYTTSRICGGRGGGGPEAIEEARIIAYLSARSGGGDQNGPVNPDVQWEVMSYDTTKDPWAKKFADLVYYDHTQPAGAQAAQLYEIRQVGSRFATAGTDAQDYANWLGPDGPNGSPINAGMRPEVDLGTILSGWHDAFLGRS